MSAHLPARPNLTYLKRQARKLLRGVRSADSAALSRVEESLPNQRRKTLNSQRDAFGLRDALLVIARECGFPSWEKLTANLTRDLADPATEPVPDTVPDGRPASGFKQIFANLYRIDSHLRKKSGKVSYSYLLVRKQGNLLICNQQSLVDGCLEEIDALGGIDTQLIARYTDSKRGDYHDMLHRRFGCKLCYHEAERSMTRTKTKCPAVTFGDDGLEIGADFKAHLFSNHHRSGACLFSWRYRGKNYLFSGGGAKPGDDEWDMHFDPELWPEKRALFGELLKLKLDYMLPDSSAAGEEDIHRFTEKTRRLFFRSIRSKLKPRQAGLKASTPASRLRVVTNYVSEELWAVIESTGSFEVDKMSVHGNCAMPLLMIYLEGADVMLFQTFVRKFGPRHAQVFLPALREHVEKGGGLLLADDRLGGDDRQVVSCHPFPEVGVAGEPASYADSEIPGLVIDATHPATGSQRAGTRFTPSIHEHDDHRHVAYRGRTYGSEAHHDPAASVQATAFNDKSLELRAPVQYRDHAHHSLYG